MISINNSASSQNGKQKQQFLFQINQIVAHPQINIHIYKKKKKIAHVNELIQFKNRNLKSHPNDGNN